MSAKSGTITYNTNSVTAQNCDFNATTGILTCTIPGRYLVTFSGLAENNSAVGDVSIEIRKNNVVEVRGYFYKQANRHQAQVTINGILSLAVGDTVYVNSTAFLHQHFESFFTGHLIGHENGQ
jgi:hypothetical protein